MGKYDGKVTISTALDNSSIEKDVREVSGEFGGLKKVLSSMSKMITSTMEKPASEACSEIRKELAAVEKQIAQCQKEIQKAGSAKMPLEDQVNHLGAALDAAKAKLEELQAKQASAEGLLSAAGNRELSGPEIDAYMDAFAQKPALDNAVIEQQAQVDALQKKWDDCNNKIDKYTSKIDKANQEMADQQVAADELRKKLDATEAEAEQIRSNISSSKNEMGAMGKAAKQFSRRLKSIAFGALLFNGISAGLRDVTDYLGKTLRANEDFTSELAKLKGALLTAFQPIYEAVAPAVTSLMKILTAATVVVADFFASLSGKSLESSAAAAKELYDQANALGQVEKNAKKAGKAFAGFDEINVLQDRSGGSSAESDSITPNFSTKEWLPGGDLDKLKDTFKDIAEYITVAAVGLAGFKLGNFIADLLTTNKKAKSLKKTLSQLGKKAGLVIGITLAVTGIALETKGVVDAIQEGLSQNSLLDILGGGAAITAGGVLIGQFFGKGVLGGAVGAIVGGIPAYITGIYDAAVNGLDWMNASLVAISSTAVGVGIGSLFGPVGTGVGALIGFATGLVTDGILLLMEDSVEPAIEVLTEAEKQFMEKALEAADAFQLQREKTQESMAAIEAQMGHVSDLADELDELVDVNGRVQKSDEGRVQFILNELNKALGTEYEMVDGIITNYQTLRGEIKKTIAAKKANLLLDAKEADYTAALLGKADAWDAVTLAEKEYLAQKESSDKKIRTLEAERQEALRMAQIHFENLNGVQQILAEQEAERLAEQIAAEKAYVADAKALYDKAAINYSNHCNTIAEYEQATQLVLEGSYESATNMLLGKMEAYTQYADNVEGETQRALRALAEEVNETKNKAEAIKRAFDEGIAGFGQEMVDEAQRTYEETLAAFNKAKADAKSLGINFGDGFHQGLKSTVSDVVGAAKSLVEGALAGIRQVAQINSPSRITTEDGAYMGKGLVNGLKSMTKTMLQAAKEQVNKLLDVYSGISIGGNVGVSSLSWNMSVPRVPPLAQGAVLPANKPFMAVVGDQKHGTNIEAPLSTIQEAVALVMQDQTQAILAGFEASVGIQREILEAVLGIQIGDEIIGNAVNRYNQKRAIIEGGMA